jgi:hypothetical protein
MTMADENIAKSCEKSKENGVKMKEDNKANGRANLETSVDVKINGKPTEITKSIISQKSPPTHSQKGSQTHPAEASTDINHVAQKSGKSKSESKSSHETPSKDKKKTESHGKLSFSSSTPALYGSKQPRKIFGDLTE